MYDALTEWYSEHAPSKKRRSIGRVSDPVSVVVNSRFKNIDKYDGRHIDDVDDAADAAAAANAATAAAALAAAAAAADASGGSGRPGQHRPHLTPALPAVCRGCQGTGPAPTGEPEGCLWGACFEK